MEKSSLLIKVDGPTSREANLLADSLTEQLIKSIRDIELDRQKEKKDTLDAGTLIVAVVGTQFAVELAKTLHAWLMRNHDASVSIGGVKASGISSADVLSIVKMQLRERSR
jgi:hypothetical protein